MRGVFRLVFWALVLGATLVFGIGLGSQLGREEGDTEAVRTTERSRGELTATLPTRTITKERRVTVRTPAPPPARRAPARG